MDNKEKRSWTTMSIQKTTLKRLNSLKQHRNQSCTEVIDMLLDSYDKKQVKLNESE